MNKPVHIKNDTKINDSDLAKLKGILNDLKIDNMAIEFLFPVNYIELGLLDYQAIIHKPMDLNTIDGKLQNNEYKAIYDVLEDIQLIWDNCKRYNIEGSPIYGQAEHMEKLTNKLIKNYYIIPKRSVNLNLQDFNYDAGKNVVEKDFDEPVSTHEMISIKDQLELSKKIKSLNPGKFSNFIKYIKTNCHDIIVASSSGTNSMELNLSNNLQYFIVIKNYFSSSDSIQV